MAFSSGSCWLALELAGEGVRWTRQRVPFHRSANVGRVALKLAPVAVHACGEVQDTAARIPPGDPCGSGTAWMRQFVPFHASAKGRVPPVRVFWWPTAVHARAAEHDTPKSAVLAALGTA
jgi:hypothetical protein